MSQSRERNCDIFICFTVRQKYSVNIFDEEKFYFSAEKEYDENILIIMETREEKRQRDALLYYIKNEIIAD